VVAYAEGEPPGTASQLPVCQHSGAIPQWRISCEQSFYEKPNNNHERPPDSAELQPFARLTNQREANKIGLAMQAGGTEINAADNMRGY